MANLPQYQPTGGSGSATPNSPFITSAVMNTNKFTNLSQLLAPACYSPLYPRAIDDLGQIVLRSKSTRCGFGDSLIASVKGTSTQTCGKAGRALTDFRSATPS